MQEQASGAIQRPEKRQVVRERGAYLNEGCRCSRRSRGPAEKFCKPNKMRRREHHACNPRVKLLHNMTLRTRNCD